VFTKSLPSNERLFLLHYSGFRASFHNMKRITCHGRFTSSVLPGLHYLDVMWNKLWHMSDKHSCISMPGVSAGSAIIT
jgi:hypothetical protein